MRLDPPLQSWLPDPRAGVTPPVAAARSRVSRSPPIPVAAAAELPKLPIRLIGYARPTSHSRPLCDRGRLRYERPAGRVRQLWLGGRPDPLRALRRPRSALRTRRTPP